MPDTITDTIHDVLFKMAACIASEMDGDEEPITMNYFKEASGYRC